MVTVVVVKKMKRDHKSTIMVKSFSRLFVIVFIYSAYLLPGTGVSFHPIHSDARKTKVREKFASV